MKTSTLPPLRVDPKLREAVERVLADGETLSSFVEASVRAQIDRRMANREFIARGLASREQARLSCDYASASAVLKKLESRLGKAKVAARPKSAARR